MQLEAKMPLLGCLFHSQDSAVQPEGMLDALRTHHYQET